MHKMPDSKRLRNRGGRSAVHSLSPGMMAVLLNHRFSKGFRAGEEPDPAPPANDSPCKARASCSPNLQVQSNNIGDGCAGSIFACWPVLQDEQGERGMKVNWKDHIVSTPDVLRGKPRIKGNRIPVSLVLGYLAEGISQEGIIEEFPDLTREDIAACLDYARALADFEVAL